MGEMTLDINTLMERWMKLYMNLMIVNSTDSGVTQNLEHMKEKMAETNEFMMSFFDSMGATVEV